MSHPIATAETRRNTATATQVRGREARAVILALGCCGAAAAVGLGANLAGIQLSRWSTPNPFLEEERRIAALPRLPSIDATVVARGRMAFLTTCASCHGPEGRGMKGLGKDLVTSEFAASRDDSSLVAFLKVGRAANDPLNTTGVLMPPKGGAAQLADSDLADIVAFIRVLHDPRRVAPDELAAAEAAMAAAEQRAAEARRAARLAAAASAGSGAGAVQQGSAAPAVQDEDPEWISFGREAFVASCSSCHGPDAKGIKGSGKDLTTSEFVAAQSEEALIAFVKKGRPSGDPLNTTKVDMPPKGGNPALSDEKLEAIASYLKSLQKEKKP
ncbi:MAG: c-type cytochrome [Phycisphaerales bacterium]